MITAFHIELLFISVLGGHDTRASMIIALMATPTQTFAAICKAHSDGASRYCTYRIIMSKILAISSFLLLKFFFVLH